MLTICEAVHPGRQGTVAKMPDGAGPWQWGAWWAQTLKFGAEKGDKFAQGLLKLCGADSASLDAISAPDPTKITTRIAPEETNKLMHRSVAAALATSTQLADLISLYSAGVQAICTELRYWGEDESLEEADWDELDHVRRANDSTNTWLPKMLEKTGKSRNELREVAYDCGGGAPCERAEAAKAALSAPTVNSAQRCAALMASIRLGPELLLVAQYPPIRCSFHDLSLL